MTPPKPRTFWNYIGGGAGKGVHMVLFHDGPEVITWSVTPSTAGMGYSWMGSVKDFYANFTPQK